MELHISQSWHFPVLRVRITNIHTSACCFLGPSCVSWVGVSRQTAVPNAVCFGWLEVPASVSHGRWLTLSLRSLSLSALASLSFFSISTRSNRHGLWEEEQLRLLLKRESLFLYPCWWCGLKILPIVVYIHFISVLKDAFIRQAVK